MIPVFFVRQTSLNECEICGKINTQIIGGLNIVLHKRDTIPGSKGGFHQNVLGNKSCSCSSNVHFGWFVAVVPKYVFFSEIKIKI